MGSGPLAGVRIVEIAGIGPGPFAALMLSDMGADVVRVDRPPRASEPSPAGVLLRGRRSIAIDLKTPEGVDTVLGLAERSEALIEPFRPGVAERLGIGPDACMARNSRLVYGRMTGWGQEGPLAHSAGHDINYIALAGALFHLGREGQAPSAPLNLIGDFGGGGMLMAFGVTCGLLHARQSGEGQVVDAAMVDGAALLMTMFHEFRAMGQFDEERRGRGLLDGGAPFYDVYETAEGEWVAIGSIEPQFYAELLRLLGVSESDVPRQMDAAGWSELRERLTLVFKSKTRSEWCRILEGTDVCFAPVLRMGEAVRHPHNVERRTFTDVAGVIQPAPAPRFSATAPQVQRPAASLGEHTDEVLSEWLDLDDPAIGRLRSCGAVA